MDDDDDDDDDDGFHKRSDLSCWWNILCVGCVWWKNNLGLTGANMKNLLIRGGRKGLRCSGFALFLVRFCSNFYFNSRFCSFNSKLYGTIDRNVMIILSLINSLSCDQLFSKRFSGATVTLLSADRLLEEKAPSNPAICKRERQSAQRPSVVKCL